jgi:hypothetical protein
MNYTKKSFSVNAPGSKSYAENWERTFRGELKPTPCCGTMERKVDMATGTVLCSECGSVLAQEPDAK